MPSVVRDRWAEELRSDGHWRVRWWATRVDLKRERGITVTLWC